MRCYKGYFVMFWTLTNETLNLLTLATPLLFFSQVVLQWVQWMDFVFITQIHLKKPSGETFLVVVSEW